MFYSSLNANKNLLLSFCELPPTAEVRSFVGATFSPGQFFREGPMASQLITNFRKTLTQFLYSLHSLPNQLVYELGTTNYR